MRGKFITLEGGEGSGKSTQIKRLVEFLRGKDIEVVQTREPGGPASAEAIRELWLTQVEGYWDPMTEVLLLMAARRENIAKVVLPALERGAWVVSDRFMDSCRVYQGMVLGVGVPIINDLYKFTVDKLEPDLTILLDLPVALGLERVGARKNKPDDRHDSQKASFHQKLRDGFLSLAKDEPQRIKTVDASADIASVSAAVERIVTGHFKL